MNTQTLTDLDHGITLIDTGFHGPRVAASYLLVERGRAAFVETGTALAVGRLLAALEHHGLERADVELVLVTHVHLDHAGGAGALLRELPNARLVVHPRGARHLVDPGKLIAGATAVYGEEQLRAHYGTVVPVPAERVVEAPDGHVAELAGRPLRILDTPGHARHHYCVYDERSRGIFSGDTFGLGYPDLRTASGPFLFPTTSPVQLDPDAMHASIDRLLALAPERIFLTHFGPVGEPARLGPALHELLDEHLELARRVRDAPDRADRLRTGVMGLLLTRLSREGSRVPEDRARELLAMDVELNAQGLDVWLERQTR